MLLRIIGIIGLFLSLMITLSCTSSKNSVRVRHFSANEQEIKDFHLYTFEFNKEIAPVEKIGQWSEIEYVRFTPNIKGKFKWIERDKLVFSPEEPLLPATKYFAKLTSKITESTPYTLKGKKEFSFHSPYFDVLEVEFFWNNLKNTEFMVAAQANIRFSYPVDPVKIKDFLTIKKDDKTLSNYQILNDKPSPIISVALGDIQRTDKDQHFKMYLKKGLPAYLQNRNITLRQEKVFKNVLSAKQNLEIQNIFAGTEYNNAWIEIHTNQSIEPNSASDYITVSPKVNYKLSVEDNVTRLEGDFQPATEYTVSIKAGLKGLYGGKLHSTKTEKVSIGNLKPFVEFANPTGKYLLREGLKNIEIKVVNVPEIEIEVTEIYKNNVWAYLHNHYPSRYGKGYTYDEENQGYQTFYYNDYSTEVYLPYIGNYGKVIYTERYSTQAPKNKVHSVVINLERALKQRFEGIYVLSVRNTNDTWNEKHKIVMFSNLGVIIKKGKNEIMCFVNSMKDNTPVANTKVNVIDKYNQTILQGTTNSEGIVVFENITEHIQDREPQMVLVENGKDFNFVHLDEIYVPTARFDVGGKEITHNQYDSYLYPERNLYRPGETAYFSGIVRDKRMKVVKDLPVIFQVHDAQNKKIASVRKVLNEQGSFEVALPIPDYANTGTYTASLYTESEDLLGTYSFFVEDFVPDKLKINTKINQEIFKAGEELKLDVQALNLFGPPASEKKYEVEVLFNPQKFVSKNYPDFNFYAKVEKTHLPTHIYKTGTLDNQGKTNFYYKFPKLQRVPAVLQGKVLTTVFDATNRPNSQVNSFIFYPQDYYIGIQKLNSCYSTQQPVQIQAVAVSPEDKVKAGLQIEAKLIRYEWHNVFRQTTQGYDYQSDRKEILVKKEQITVKNSPFTFTVIPDRSGEYEVRLSAVGDEVNYISTVFSAYDWESTTYTSFKANREGNIDILPDKQTYYVGQQAKILFKTPFDGKMLVTIEREKVLKYYYLTTKNRTAQLSISLEDNHLPNVYVAATLFNNATAINQQTFYVAHGYQNLNVENPKNRLNVQIITPKKVQPNKTQEVIVQTNTNQPVFVTLAAVDEGICQVKNFASPDPYSEFYGRKKLNVESFDLYKLMLNEVNRKPAIPLAHQGEYGSAREEFSDKPTFKDARKNPFTVKRFKPVSVWSGIIATQNGVAKIKVPIPNFNGQIRLMAVAYMNEKMGAAQDQMLVVDDIVATPSIPRFIAPQDSIELPVSLYNTTQTRIIPTISVKTEGPVKIIGKSTQSTSVSAQQESILTFKAAATTQLGPAKIIITTEYNGKTVTDVTEISVRPASPLYVQTGSGQIQAGTTQNITIPNNYVPNTQRSTLVVSKFPAVQFAQHLKYLIGYPHGCLEQTTSKLFVMLYAEDIIRAACGQELKGENISYYIKQGIQKIENMQLVNGDFSYWQGANESNWWTSVYATHFLLEAQKAGYSVDKTVLQKALRYVAKRSAENSTYSYVSYSSGDYSKRRVRKIANKEIIYGLYVLALAQQADYASMNYYKSHPELLTKDMKYMLAGAFALTHQRSAIQYLLTDKFDTEKTDKNLSENFDSDIRADAIILSVLADIDPHHSAIPTLIRKFAEDKNSEYWNTQERAFVCVGIGKLARTQSSQNVTATIKDGAAVYTFTGKELSIPIKNNSLTITTHGSGRLYYFWHTEGISYTPIKEVDAGLQVRRTFYDRSGKEIKNTFTQNDIVICKITISAVEGKTLQNVAISELIPAGFEIENPRLKDLPELNVNTTDKPQYMDVRDDRLLLYTDVTGSKNFYYMLRAVTVGSFALPPIGAEAMYAPEYHSYHGAKRIKVISQMKG
ncbi:MAG: MG2 domain-containing protein [Bacteroidia bacterium]|nr:MG2 domain-containing protein [Bacteroidia bacterium]